IGILRHSWFSSFRKETRSTHSETAVMRNVAAHVGGEHASLHFEHPSVAHFVAEDRVGHDGSLALLIALEEPLRPCGREGAALSPYEELLRRQTACVDECEHYRVSDDGSKLFHQIERERWFAVSPHVEKTVVRIKAYGAEGGKAIL